MAGQEAIAPAPPLSLRVAQGYDDLSWGRAEAALAAADAVLARAPDLVDALILRGAALKAAGRFNDAIAAFQAGLARDPRRVAAHVSLANAHAEMGEYPAAEAVLRQALAISPRMKTAHASLISVCAMMKRDDLMEAACRAALAVDPDSVNAHQHLADLYARCGRPVEARRHRDAAYRRQNLFVEPATRPAPTALVLLTTEDGNIPLKYLLSRDRYTVIKWLIEYATPDQATRLPRYDLVLNAIGEPELPPETHAAVERFRQVCSAPFLNRPDRVVATSRISLPVLLGDLADVVVPSATRWWAGDAPPTIGWPALVRPVGSHGGAGLTRVGSASAFLEAARPYQVCDVAAFHDFAGPDGLFRKYRAIFIDRRPYPYHLAIGTDWLVHYVTTNMLNEPQLRAEEERFLDDPTAAIGARAMAALSAIGRRLDLDYAGIDFSVLPDGRVLVFEANATMVLHPEAEGGVLAYKNRPVAAILAAFDAMARPLPS
jgi:tetratricopeptide (TPR) repeat protein